MIREIFIVAIGIILGELALEIIKPMLGISKNKGK